MPSAVQQHTAFGGMLLHMAVQVLVRLTGGPMVLHVLRLGAASMSWEVKAWSILDGGCPANRSVDGHWAPWACPARGVQVLNSGPLPTPDHCLIYSYMPQTCLHWALGLLCWHSLGTGCALAHA